MERSPNIDGQQRCTALDRFINGNLQLYGVEDENSKLPVFLRDTENILVRGAVSILILWPRNYRMSLLGTDLPVAFITDADENEVRDLFIRLQSGSALNEQEKRDAYPGAVYRISS